MSSELRMDIIDFAIHLPSNVNPYIALADHLTNVEKVTGLPVWAIAVQSFTIFSYVGVLLGAIWLLRARFLTKNFKFVSISNLGLIEIDLVNTLALLGVAYASVSIPDLIYWQLVHTGRCRVYGAGILVMGGKFVLLLHMAFFSVGMRM
ncbi:uncharacterized protein MELLADRAFT_88752 [Melampsora larici-populina 98AG31]|uniref:G-protein coupled receptors family 1 profile domain-containing protein n=1 Tax=Melampsora larici-populina (strain 98AG31 / pathotype 3-4-7) TaxID=747676 RepID=F4RSV1_MELLP|nr:uncharacterized protein MELLADRAFT_88752 [Melampsora larici-populina 98AG31]EGG04542.1 hypothetical protein MELLADRAFT_88752 [Melampsora larici-populina 98AG31]